MQRAAAARRYEALHEERPYHDGNFRRWFKDPGPNSPFHFRDGVTIWVASTDVNPEDDFLKHSTQTGGGDVGNEA
jgi:hypothetical protein